MFCSIRRPAMLLSMMSSFISLTSTFRSAVSIRAGLVHITVCTALKNSLMKKAYSFKPLNKKKNPRARILFYYFFAPNASSFV